MLTLFYIETVKNITNVLTGSSKCVVCSAVLLPSLELHGEECRLDLLPSSSYSWTNDKYIGISPIETRLTINSSLQRRTIKRIRTHIINSQSSLLNSCVFLINRKYHKHNQHTRLDIALKTRFQHRFKIALSDTCITNCTHKENR